MPTLTLDYIYNHIASPETIDLAVIFQKSLYGYLYLKGHGFKPHQYGSYLDASASNNTTLKAKILPDEMRWNWQHKKIAIKEKNKALLDEAQTYYVPIISYPFENID